MPRENAVFARKIIDFYTDRGVECSVVDEQSTLLVTLSADGNAHEFRYGKRAFAGIYHWKKFYLVLEGEWSKLKEAVPAPAPAAKNHSKLKYRSREDAGEEMYVNI
ncbi:MAG: hypothetical protein KKH28_08840 [Elusimicrobia bacterium]|nr:hypothetical protein [Elusimicrobiota bacterium]